jgi:hypothetical protein
MDKLNLSDNESKRKKGKKQESPSGSQGSPDEMDDNKSVASSRSKVSSIKKTKSICKNRATAISGPAAIPALSIGSTAASPDIFNNTNIN